jgi:hypothetical protein
MAVRCLNLEHDAVDSTKVPEVLLMEVGVALVLQHTGLVLLGTVRVAQTHPSIVISLKLLGH